MGLSSLELGFGYLSLAVFCVSCSLVSVKYIFYLFILSLHYICPYLSFGKAKGGFSVVNLLFQSAPFDLIFLISRGF